MPMSSGLRVQMFRSLHIISLPSPPRTQGASLPHPHPTGTCPQGLVSSFSVQSTLHSPLSLGNTRYARPTPRFHLNTQRQFKTEIPVSVAWPCYPPRATGGWGSYFNNTHRRPCSSASAARLLIVSVSPCYVIPPSIKAISLFLYASTSALLLLT